MKKILIIDDEESFTKMLEERLAKVGYEVTCVLNGSEGRYVLRKEKPDLIILDILMPIMDGYDFYKGIKREPDTSDIPVIIVTAKPDMKEVIELVDRDLFMAKPIDLIELESKIRSILR
jgi:DNA-binding response OmpR family regulator